MATFLIAFAVVGLAFLGLASGLLVGRRGPAGGCRVNLGAPPEAGCAGCSSRPRSTTTKRHSEAP